MTSLRAGRCVGEQEGSQSVHSVFHQVHAQSRGERRKERESSQGYSEQGGEVECSVRAAKDTQSWGEWWREREVS